MDRKSAFRLALVFSVALALRAAVFAAALGRDPGLFLQPDSHGYARLAANLAAHGAFSQSDAPPLAPDQMRTPGYPLLLAPFLAAGAPPWAAIPLQVLLSAGLAVLAAWAALRLGGDARAATVSGLLVALDIPSVFMANAVLTETLFAALVAGSLVALAAFLATRRPALAALSGAGIGAAALTRPSGAILAPALAAALLLAAPLPARARAAAAAVLLGAAALSVAPWIARNAHRFGTPVLSGIAVENLLVVQGAGVLSVVEGVPYREAQSRLESEYARSPAAAGTLAEQRTWKLRRARGIIAANPLVYARNYAVGIANTLLRPLRRDVARLFGAGGPSSLQTWGGESQAGAVASFLRGAPGAVLAALAFQVLHLAVLYGGCAAALLRRAPLAVPGAAAVLLAAVAALCLGAGSPETYARFRVPLVPILALGAGLGLGRRVAG